MAKSGHGKLYGFLIVIALIGGIWYLSDGGLLSVNDKGGVLDTGVLKANNKPVANEGGTLFNGDATMKVILSNAMNNTSYTDSTQMDFNYYKMQGGSLTFIVQSSSGSATVPISPGDKYVYVELVSPASQAFYPAIDAVLEHPKISYHGYEDLDKDNIWSHVVKFDVSDLPEAPQTTDQSSRTWYAKLWGEGSLSLTTNGVSSLTGVGQGNVVNVLEFEPTMDQKSSAEAVTEIKITMNSTDTTQWLENDSFIDIPNGATVQRIKLSDMDRSDLASTTVYKHKYGTTIENANFLTVGNTGTLKIQTPVTIKSNFDASDEALCVELQLTTVTARGVFSTTSDDGEITEGSTNVDECTL